MSAGAGVRSRALVHLSHCPPVLLSRTVLAFLGDSFMSVIVVFPTVHEGIVLLL